jgi:hypothetical protein
MVSLRRLAWCVETLPNSTLTLRTYPPRWTARTGGPSGTALILCRVGLERSLRETEDYPNKVAGALVVFDLGEAPHYPSLCP